MTMLSKVGLVWLSLLLLLQLQSARSFVLLKPSLLRTAKTVHDVKGTKTGLAVAEDMNIESDENNEPVPQPECAALLPGQVLSIRVGDTSQPRKAWKKRRRSGSPVLVPCSICGMDRNSMVMGNIINILHRFGKPIGSDAHNGVALTVGALVKLYKYRLGGNLLAHSKSLGHTTIVAFLKAAFDENFYKEHGVEVLRDGPKNELLLSSSLSIRLAREAANKAEFVQFLPSLDDQTRMAHTGTAFQIVTVEEKYKTFDLPNNVQPLSAAVRISQADADSSRIQEGMECNAFILSYDANGDNGSPLVTCTMDPPMTQIRDQMKRRSYVKRQLAAKEDRMEANDSANTDKLRELTSLRVGDGPFKATVARISSRVEALFVDLDVGRKQGKKNGGGVTKALGMLKFDDIILDSSEVSAEEAAIIEASLDDYNDDSDEISSIDDLFMNEETVEDVSDSYAVEDDGIMYLVGEDGSKEKLGTINEEVEETGDDEDDDFAGMTPQQRLHAIGEMLASEEETEVKQQKKVGQDISKCLNIGDEVNVYIRSVSKQSGRFTVTTDPSIKGRKSKDLKKEKLASKRLSKLAAKMGGEEELERISELVGKEIAGEIKAKSKSGDWYYFQPDEEHKSLPVGVASCSDSSHTYSPGDKATVRLEGIDQSRGQLSFTLINAV